MIEQVLLENIRPNPWGPPRPEDAEALEKLATSIKRHGLQQVPVGRVAPEDSDAVELACGHRRYDAYKWLRSCGLTQYDAMPVDVQELSDEQMANVAWVENADRLDVDPIAEAQFMQRYMEDFGVTQVELARRLGMSQPAASNTLRLLRLPEAVRGRIISREITARHGRALLEAERWPEVLQEAAQVLDKRPVTVEELERHVQGRLQQHAKPLDPRYYQGAQFDTTECQKCPDRVVIRHYGVEKEPHCMNASCFDGKQRQVQAERHKATQEKVSKAAAGATDDSPLILDDLPFDSYETMWEGDELRDSEECTTCEHRKLAKYRASDEQTRVVCLKPACIRSKRSAATKERNRLARDLEALREDRERRAVEGVTLEPDMDGNMGELHAANALVTVAAVAVSQALAVQGYYGGDLKRLCRCMGLEAGERSVSQVCDELAVAPVPQLLRGLSRWALGYLRAQAGARRLENGGTDTLVSLLERAGGLAEYEAELKLSPPSKSRSQIRAEKKAKRGKRDDVGVAQEVQGDGRRDS